MGGSAVSWELAPFLDFCWEIIDLENFCSCTRFLPQTTLVVRFLPCLTFLAFNFHNYAIIVFPKRTKNHSSCWRNANDGSKHPPKLQNEKIPPAEKCTFPETSFPHLLHNFRTFPIFLCNFYENLQQEYFTKIGRKLHTDAWRTIVSSCLVNHSWNGWNSLHLQIHAGKKKTCRKKIRKNAGIAGTLWMIVGICGNCRKTADMDPPPPAGPLWGPCD